MRIKQTALSILIIGIAVTAITGIADDASQAYAEQALKRALTTYAVARTLNGVISVAQGTEVALEPGGVGVMLTPGQILDPVNDLVERFSSVMLVAASSLGLQLIIAEILSWWVVTALLVAALLLWLGMLFSPVLRNNKYLKSAPRIVLFLVLIRFAIPVVIISSNLLFETFLLTRHDTATAELTSSSMDIEMLSSEFGGATESDDLLLSEDGEVKDQGASEIPVWERIWHAGDSAISTVTGTAAEWAEGVKDWVSSMSIPATFAQLEKSASQATSHIVDLIVIFLLQTIIAPLAFLWLFVEVLKAIAFRSLSKLSGE